MGLVQAEMQSTGPGTGVAGHASGASHGGRCRARPALGSPCAWLAASQRVSPRKEAAHGSPELLLAPHRRRCCEGVRDGDRLRAGCVYWHSDQRPGVVLQSQPCPSWALPPLLLLPLAPLPAVPCSTETFVFILSRLSLLSFVTRRCRRRGDSVLLDLSGIPKVIQEMLQSSLWE
ncbi:hypothetical protein VTN96DRAFT_3834 [Rasamsonia emersonii]